MRYGTVGAGSYPHYDMAYFNKKAGDLDMIAIHNKAGAAGVINDMVTGDTQVTFLNAASTIAMVKAGKLRALAVTTAQRWPGAADIPTVAESVPGYEVSGWFGLLAPAGTPKAVLDTLQTAVAQAVRDPEVTRQLRNLGAEPVASRPEVFARQIRADVDKWRGVVKATGVTLE